MSILLTIASFFLTLKFFSTTKTVMISISVLTYWLSMQLVNNLKLLKKITLYLAVIAVPLALINLVFMYAKMPYMFNVIFIALFLLHFAILFKTCQIVLMMLHNRTFIIKPNCLALIALQAASLLLYEHHSASIAYYHWSIDLLIMTLGWITIYTDTLFMVISRFASLYWIPFAWIAAYYNIISPSLTESIATSIAGMLLFWTCNQIFKRWKGFDGLGQGDVDLIGLIGATTGFVGLWFALQIGSLACLIASLTYRIFIDKKRQMFPFGTFLAAGWIGYIIMYHEIATIISNYF